MIGTPGLDPFWVREGHHLRVVRTGDPDSPFHQPYALGRITRVTPLCTRDSVYGILVHVRGLFPWNPAGGWWIPLDHSTPATEEEWVAQQVLDQIES